jgi:hypothetical protein
VRDLAIAGWVLGPLVGVRIAFGSLDAHGWSWRLLGPAAVLGLGVALGALALARRRAWSAWTLLGLALTVLLPAAFVGFHEDVYAFDDWPCSGMNFHVRLHPWLRLLALLLCVGLLTAAGVAWVRRKGRGRAVALTAAALLVLASSGYTATRSGCGGRVIQGWLLGPVEDVDPGCEIDGCYCGVVHDGVGRALLLRARAPPARLWVPTWLLRGGRPAVEELLLYQDSPPLPHERCLDDSVDGSF